MNANTAGRMILSELNASRDVTMAILVELRIANKFKEIELAERLSPGKRVAAAELFEKLAQGFRSDAGVEL